MTASINRLTTFAAGIREHGFTDVVLLGMGGSSLAPEVLRAILGTAPGFPSFHVLDSTDPAAVLAVAARPEQTLYILASKSGTTIEPNSLAAYFQDRLRKAGVSRWADHFVAITDEGTELAARAERERFREVFINPSDIGGRYSALSFFGLVPAALLGQDVASLLDWSLAMLEAAEEPDAMSNPAVSLGLLMGAGAKSGRDKLTLALPPELEPLGLWVEQLVAESTGKAGVGLLPVVGEAASLARLDNPDRLFCLMSERSHPGTNSAPAFDGVTSPTFTIDLAERTALGAEFVRWEIATAVAGALLEINPFDEPNVQQAKDATRILLDQFGKEGRLPLPVPDDRSSDGVSLTLSVPARDRLQRTGESVRPANFLTLLDSTDYLALLAYLGPDPKLSEVLQEFRNGVLTRTKRATTIGYGPRYLHSTGQLHKGGPNSGVFIVVTAVPRTDLAIPEERFSFGTLELAQALGDFRALEAAGRRALHVHLPHPDPETLRQALQSLEKRLTLTP
jgi:glucose-6-phosphate isomerase